MENKKILLVYYSRTGITKKVAEEILKSLNCDIEEVVDTKNRAGAIGYIMAGKDATLKSLTQIKETTKNPGDYDMVIIGTPIWAFTMSTPIRTYIEQNKDKFKKVAFFCTQGSSGSDGGFKDMETICGQKPINILELKTKEVAKNEFNEKINSFINEIK